MCKLKIEKVKNRLMLQKQNNDKGYKYTHIVKINKRMRKMKKKSIKNGVMLDHPPADAGMLSIQCGRQKEPKLEDRRRRSLEF